MLSEIINAFAFGNNCICTDNLEDITALVNLHNNFGC